MPKAKYTIPSFLKVVCSADDYRRWLEGKAQSNVYRDRRRGNKNAKVGAYKEAIHKATIECQGKDAYTGKPLKWDLLHKYNNTESKQKGREYKKCFADLPTVDHVDDGKGDPNFKICAWRVNDSKHDLTLEEFIEVCRDVLRHNAKK